MIKQVLGAKIGFTGSADVTSVVTIGSKNGELAFLFNVDERSSVALTEPEAFGLLAWAHAMVVGFMETRPFGHCKILGVEVGGVEVGAKNYGFSQVCVTQGGRVLDISMRTLSSVLEWGCGDGA